MVKKVVMPSAGQTTDVATVTKLHVAVGDAVVLHAVARDPSEECRTRIADQLPVQVEGRSIPSSEKQVVLYSFFVLDLYSLRPRCASLAPDTVLIEPIFFQHIKTVLAHLKGTV